MCVNAARPPADAAETLITSIMYLICAAYEYMCVRESESAEAKCNLLISLVINFISCTVGCGGKEIFIWPYCFRPECWANVVLNKCCEPHTGF